MNTLKIPDILYDLLMEHYRVSVPCLGSFTAEHQPAALSENRLELLPPCKKVSFNPKEIWNDERLERELATRKKCSLAEAQELVAFWVDELCFTLATTGTVSIDRIGTLTSNNSNQIVFTATPNINFLKDAYGLTPVTLRKQIPVFKKEEKPAKKKGSYAWLIAIAVLLAVAGALLYAYRYL